MLSGADLFRDRGIGEIRSLPASVNIWREICVKLIKLNPGPGEYMRRVTSCQTRRPAGCSRYYTDTQDFSSREAGSMELHEQHSPTSTESAETPTNTAVSVSRRRVLKATALVAVPAVLTVHAGHARAQALTSAVRCSINALDNPITTDDGNPNLYRKDGDAVWFNIDPTTGEVTPILKGEQGYMDTANGSFLSTGCVTSALHING